MTKKEKKSRKNRFFTYAKIKKFFQAKKSVNNPKQHPKTLFLKRESETKNPPARKKHNTEEREIFSFFERQTTDFERNFCEKRVSEDTNTKYVILSSFFLANSGQI